MSAVYLLHFERAYEPYPGAPAYKCARHYIGWAANLRRRLRDHELGQGANLIAVITRAGIGWELARTWDGAGRTFERRIKCHGAARICPICTPGNRRYLVPLRSVLWLGTFTARGCGEGGQPGGFGPSGLA